MLLLCLQLYLQQQIQQDSTAFWSWHAACVQACDSRSFFSTSSVASQYVQVRVCYAFGLLVPLNDQLHRAWCLQSWDVKENGPIDPFAIAEPEIDSISERLRQSLLTDIPALGKAAEYFFQVCRHSTQLDRQTECSCILCSTVALCITSMYCCACQQHTKGLVRHASTCSNACLQYCVPECVPMHTCSNASIQIRPILNAGMAADWGRGQTAAAHNAGPHGLCLFSCSAIC